MYLYEIEDLKKQITYLDNLLAEKLDKITKKTEKKYGKEINLLQSKLEELTLKISEEIKLKHNSENSDDQKILSELKREYQQKENEYRFAQKISVNGYGLLLCSLCHVFVNRKGNFVSHEYLVEMDETNYTKDYVEHILAPRVPVCPKPGKIYVPIWMMHEMEDFPIIESFSSGAKTDYKGIFTEENFVNLINTIGNIWTTRYSDRDEHFNEDEDENLIKVLYDNTWIRLNSNYDNFDLIIYYLKEIFYTKLREGNIYFDWADYDKIRELHSIYPDVPYEKVKK